MIQVSLVTLEGKTVVETDPVSMNPVIRALISS